MPKKQPTEKQWLTSREAAELLGLSRRHVAQLVSDGKLRSDPEWDGYGHRISRESVEAYAAVEHKTGPKPKIRENDQL